MREGLEIESRPEGDLVVLVCRGEIDLATAPILSRALRGLPAVDIVLDLSDVELIDTAGLHAVLNGLRRTTRAGRGFVLCCAPSPLHRVFELMGLRDTLPICEGRAEAKRAARDAGARQRVRAEHLGRLTR